jgi:hypothetical protein
MMYYRCDCCGRETHRTPYDPLGESMQYLAPQVIRHLATDVCKECHDVFHREMGNLEDEYRKHADHEMVQWFKALQQPKAKCDEPKK